MLQGKQPKVTFGILSLTYILLSIFLLMAPQQSPDILAYLLGGVTVLLGIILVVFYFIKDGNQPAFRNGLAGGIVLIAAGFYLFLLQRLLIWQALPVLLGFAILYDSVLKVQSSLELKGTKYRFWWFFLLLALLTTVLGFILIIFGQKAEGFFAVILLTDGIANLIFVTFSIIEPALAKHRAKKQGKAQKKAAKTAALSSEDLPFTQASPAENSFTAPEHNDDTPPGPLPPGGSV